MRNQPMKFSTNDMGEGLKFGYVLYITTSVLIKGN